MTDGLRPDLPPFYVAVREATDSLAEAERRRSLRLALERTLGIEVRRVVELEAELAGERIGIMELQRLDLNAELARILGTQDDIEDAEGIPFEIALCRESIRQAHAEADPLTETEETLEFARRSLDSALEEWEASLLSSEAELGRQLRSIDVESATLRAQEKETREAIEAATMVAEALAAAERSVLTALRLVGTYSASAQDPWGMLTSIKKELLRGAAPSLTAAQRWLLLLQAELDDLDGKPYQTPKLPTSTDDIVREIQACGLIIRRKHVGPIRALVKQCATELHRKRTAFDSLVRKLTNSMSIVGQELDALDVQRWKLLLEPPLASD